MKRIITFSVILMALVFTVVGVSREQTKGATYEVSDGLCVIASQTDMAKSALVNEKMVFSADDFEKYLNSAQISSITVTSIPSITDGCLCVGDTVVVAGQSITRDNLDLLNYRAGNEKVKQAEFKFKVDGNEYEMTCKMYFLTRENSAPTLELEDERLFSVSTHQTITVYGKLMAHDYDGDEMRYEIVSYAKNGVIELDKQSGEYRYTPMGAYFGEDYFEYVAVDKYGNYSPSQRVSLKVEKIKTDVLYCDMDLHPAHHAAMSLTEEGIMDGVEIGSSTYFMPDKSVSRMDFLVMLMHAIGIDEVENVFDTGFDDDGMIPSKLKGYVKRARDMGIISGAVDVDGRYYFYPDRNITRAEAALMVNSIVNGKVPTVKPTFADREEIPTWAHDAIYSLNNLGILTSINGEIAPSENLTRAATAQMLYALMQHIN